MQAPGEASRVRGVRQGGRLARLVRQAGRLLTLSLAGVLAAALVSAASAYAMMEPASKYDLGGLSHNEQCIATKNGATVAMRDVEGHQLVDQGGGVTSRPEEREACARAHKKGLQMDGLEMVSAGGTESFYSWPGEPVVGQAEGFVARSDLASSPALNSEDERGNGKATSDAPGSPAYRVTPVPFSNEQWYPGGSKWYRYDPYGQPTGGAKYALMTWSWVNVSGGGVSRAAVAEGALFYPSNVEPIKLTTYAKSLEKPNGVAIARYGRVSTGSGSIYGWMVTSSTYEGACVNHMVYASGGPALPNTLCSTPVGVVSEPSVASGFAGTGSEAVVVRGEDNQVYIRFFTGAQWQPWETLGGNTLGAPAVISQGPNNLDVFARNYDSTLIHRWWNGSQWSSWEQLSGWQMVGNPAPISWGSGQEAVFIRGTNNALDQIYYANGKWSEWESLGGEIISDPTPVSIEAGDEDVFALGTNKSVWHRAFFASSWHAWEALPTFTSLDRPTAVAWPAPHQHITVFDRDPAYELMETWWEPSGWQSQWYAGKFDQLNGRVSALSSGYPNLDVFAAAKSNDTLVHTWFNGGPWSPWEQLSGWQIGEGPTAISPSPGNEDVFIRGLDNSLDHIYFVNAKWSEWESLGKPY